MTKKIFTSLFVVYANKRMKVEINYFLLHHSKENHLELHYWDLYGLFLSITYGKKKNSRMRSQRKRSTDTVFQSIFVVVKSRFYSVLTVNENTVNKKLSEN